MKRSQSVLGWLAFAATLLLLGPRVLAQDGDPSAALLAASVRLPNGDVVRFECDALPSMTPPAEEVFTPLPTNTPRPTFTATPTPIPPASCWGIVITDHLNVRSGPGIEYTVVRQYMAGQRVDVLESADTSTGEWVRVQAQPDLWVSAEYVGTGSGAVCEGE